MVQETAMRKPVFDAQGVLQKCVVCDGELKDWKPIEKSLRYSCEQTRCKKCGTAYEKNGLTAKTYAMLNLDSSGRAESIRCVECGSDIQAVTQYTSIHEFPEMMAGSGRTIPSDVPYCPKCEKKPSEFGGFIDHDPREARENAIIRGMGRRDGGD